MAQNDIDGRWAQGWGGSAPNGVHVNVQLARRGSVTAAAITTAYTSPSPGFTPILACLGSDQASYVTVNPPTIILTKTAALSDIEQTLVFGGAQLGIAQGVLDSVAKGLLEADQDTVILVSLWIDPQGSDETEVRHSARQATAAAISEAVLARSAEDRQALVDNRDDVTHPFYGGK
jgi:formaldehyde-activating enzyme